MLLLKVGDGAEITKRGLIFYAHKTRDVVSVRMKYLDKEEIREGNIGGQVKCGITSQRPTMPETRKAIGALPHDGSLPIRFKISGYNLTETGARVHDHSEEIIVHELPDILANVELWAGEYMLVQMPLAIGQGAWVYIPPIVEGDGQD